MTKNNICDCRSVQNIFSQWSKWREKGKKKNLVWKKKYREVLLGKALIWKADRENVLLGSYEVLKIAYVACMGIYFGPVILPHRVVLPLRALVGFRV